MPLWTLDLHAFTKAVQPGERSRPFRKRQFRMLLYSAAVMHVEMVKTCHQRLHCAGRCDPGRSSPRDDQALTPIGDEVVCLA